MRLRHPDGSTVHLAYCTNVHPAETLDGVLAQLRDHCEPVRRRLGRDRLGIGLWLAKDAARTLITDPATLRGLRGELDRRGLEVVTLNGFPYEGFGAEEVKYRVYKPDWADPERLEHTTGLARLLTALLPDDVTEGTISTLPLAWRTDFDERAAATATAALTTLSERLDALEERTGRSIRIALEPEPGCPSRRPCRRVRRHVPPGHVRQEPGNGADETSTTKPGKRRGWTTRTPVNRSRAQHRTPGSRTTTGSPLCPLILHPSAAATAAVPRATTKVRSSWSPPPPAQCPAASRPPK
ncbi:hypothetical protein RKD19_007904 [Streptomyces canus]